MLRIKKYVSKCRRLKDLFSSHLILESCLAQRREEREFQRESFLSNGGRKGECRTHKQEKHLEIKIKFKKEEKKKTGGCIQRYKKVYR